MKISRNSPCYCGSGKKYKRCCLGKENLPNIPWPVYPENFVIKRLIEKSKLFKKFYSVERPKILQQIYWAEDIKLPVGINYRTTRLGTGEKIIRLKHIPAQIEDCTKIAHELLHITMDFEGYPSTSTTNDKYESLSSALNSLLHDLIVNKRLLRYGMDMKLDYKQEVSESIRQLNSIYISPKEKYERARWIINYSSKILEYEIAYGRHPKKDEYFREYFNKKYPDIVKEAQPILEMIKDIGYDSPEKQIKIFMKVVAYLGLQEIIKIFSKPP